MLHTSYCGGYGAPIRRAPAYLNPQLPLAIDLIKESPNSSSSTIVIILIACVKDDKVDSALIIGSL